MHGKEFWSYENLLKGQKDHIFVIFRIFPVHGKIIFAEFSFKRKCKKAASFRKCIFSGKYKIFVFDSCM